VSQAWAGPLRQVYKTLVLAGTLPTLARALPIRSSNGFVVRCLVTWQRTAGLVRRRTRRRHAARPRGV